MKSLKKFWIINKLSATLIFITLILFSSQYSNSVSKKEYRIIVPLSDNSFKMPTYQGNYAKRAIIQNTDYYQRNIQLIEFTNETPTLDKKFVTMKIRAFWKISKIEVYQKKITDYNMAKNYVWDFTEEALRRVIIAHKLNDIVNLSEIGIIENIRCSRNIELETINLSNINLLKFGVKLVNIEARISYPI